MPNDEPVDAIDLEPDTESEAETVQHLNAIAALATRSPALALAALFVVGGGAGTLGSVFVAPVVDDALEDHARDPFAHASEFSQLRDVEQRLDAIEAQLGEQGRQIGDVSGDLKAAIRLLETRRP
jgi:hypothetical protein